MPQNIHRHIQFVAIILGVFLIALTINAFKENRYIGSGVTPTNVITVSGTGDAFAVPDIATFNFGADATAKTVADAQKQVTTIVDAALAKIKADGVADKDIQTIDYSANPKYEYSQVACPMIATAGGAPYVCPPSKQVLTGYEVNETISVKVRQVDNAGKVIGDIGGTGVTNVSGISFTVDDPTITANEARTTAIADAKTKANELAKELGVTLVRVVSFNENGGGYPQPIFMSAGIASSDAKIATPPQIPVGQNKVTSNVTITYEIR
jgi:uncharacterized protein YggE